MSRAGFAAAILLAFIAGGAVTAASLMFGLLPSNIKTTEQASPGIANNTSWLDEVDASFIEAEKALPDEIDTSFSVDSAPISVSPSENYAKIVAHQAFTITVLQIITLGIGFGIGFLINQSGQKLRRVFIGFVAGVVISWLLGVISWAVLFESNSPTAAIMGGLSRSFLFAIIGAGVGVYFGREKAKKHGPMMS